MADGARPVLVVGGTGYLGGRVIEALQSRGKAVRALLRPASDATALEAKDVSIARGDMLDPPSLRWAMEDADAVITTAAGYTRHSKGDSSDIDITGNRNLADAAAEVGVRRFVLTSILSCDKTPGVPHFWHKKLAEDRLEERNVPFVALRPGAFLDQVTRQGGDPFAKGRLLWFGSPSIPLTFVLTEDLAGYLAAAVDADLRPGERIDIGWDRPVAMQEVAAIAGAVLGKEMTVRAIPARILRGVGRTFAPVMPTLDDMSRMIAWFQTGRYVADPRRQGEVFGPVPTAEDAVRRLVTSFRE